MDKAFKVFHYVSFLQYPFLLMAIYYCYKPLILGKESMISDYNTGLLFLGIGLSFTSLADISKRTKIGNKIFGKPKNAKLWVIIISVLLLIIFSLAMVIHFLTTNEEIRQLSTGIFVLGIGTVGLLRMNLEIIKSYQKDWDGQWDW